jgi:hypothetical protein
MSVSRRPKGDVLEIPIGSEAWDDIRNLRDDRDTILLHLDTVPSNIFNIHIVAVKISKILTQVGDTD